MNKLSLLSQRKKAQQGMTFLEVLVALAIIVTGILGAVAMQATAKQASFDAMQRSLASSLAQDIIAKMRTNNPNNLANYIGDDYGIDPGDAPDPACNQVNVQCDAAQMSAVDIFEWELALSGGDVTNGLDARGGLVGGVGCISQVGNAVTVVVTWQGNNETTDSGRSNCGTAGATKRQVIVEAFII